MEITPKDLKEEFNDLFEKQKEIENDAEFQSKKRKYMDIKLETRHNMRTLSEIFQDPELLARISQETFKLMRLKPGRPSRIRHEHDLITFRKPQAKDVKRRQLVAEDIAGVYQSLEEIIDKEKEYINPLAPKQRRYMSEEFQDIVFPSNSCSAEPSAHNSPSIEEYSQSSVDESALDTTSSSINTNSSMNLALPDHPNSQIDVHNQQQMPEQSELEEILEQTSKLISQSVLETVGSKHLHTYLPRQFDPHAFRYVKEDVSIEACLHIYYVFLSLLFFVVYPH
ncbi:MAG: hypothetical protein EXX96DRAFT_485978 [Benjaminiella poitrasii]|nr:MAG: hypothetical protein EXX96DRAFT_485978 [Benjaminiella poitrasii]